jgi:hypothetical protein
MEHEFKDNRFVLGFDDESTLYSLQDLEEQNIFIIRKDQLEALIQFYLKIQRGLI